MYTSIYTKESFLIVDLTDIVVYTLDLDNVNVVYYLYLYQIIYIKFRNMDLYTVADPGGKGPCPPGSVKNSHKKYGHQAYTSCFFAPPLRSFWIRY